MAEEIEISNVGGDGVASEVTLKALLDVMSKKDPSGKTSKEVEKYNTALKSGVTVSTKNTNALKKGTTASIAATKATSAFASKLRGAAMGAIGAIAGSIGNLGKELISGGNNLSDFAQHLPLVGSHIAPLVGILDESVDSFRQLSSVGASFGNSITEMRLAAANAEMSLSEFGGFIGSNTESLRLLGGTVDQGVRRFNAINRNLKDTGDFESLKNMGFTVMEINEGMIDYIDLQANLGRNQKRDAASLAAGSSAYLTQLDALAKVTGKSRKEMAETMARQSQDAGFRALMNQFEAGSVEAENFRASMAMIDTLPAEVATGLKDLADGIPQTEEGIALLNAAGPEIGAAMEKVAAGADPQVLIDAIGKAGVDVEKFAGLEGKQRAAFIQGLRDTNPTLAAILDGATQMQKLGSAEYKKAQAEQKKRDDITKTLTTFDDKIREIRGKIAATLIESGLFDNLAGTVSTLVDGVGNAVPHIVKWLDEFANLAKEGGFGQAIQEKIINPMAKSFMDGIGNLWKDAGIATKIGTGLLALFTGAKIVGALKSAVGGLFGGIGGGSDSGGKGSKGSKGGGAGKALQGLTGGLLGGVAKGLAAFANPAVPIGAAALGAAIVAIGAGIAGAAWLTGKALPTFAEGMKSFETLDGEKLKSAGLGMVSVGAGFAAFGAGSAISGLGGIVGGITEGITSLFGGDDPLTKVKKFGDAKIDGEKVKANADAMVAFGKAMASAGAGNAAAGAGGLIGAFSSFFADDPTEQVAEFGSLDINAQGVTANANAMLVMAQGISSLSGSGISSLTIDSDLVESFEDLSKIGPGLSSAATGIKEIGAVTGLDTNITALNSLDKSGIRNYNNELERMVELLEDMNKELSKDNNGMFTKGTGTNAGSALNAIAESGSGGGELSSSMLAILQEIRDVNKQSRKALEDIARNV